MIGTLLCPVTFIGLPSFAEPLPFLVVLAEVSVNEVAEFVGIDKASGSRLQRLCPAHPLYFIYKDETCLFCQRDRVACLQPPPSQGGVQPSYYWVLGALLCPMTFIGLPDVLPPSKKCLSLTIVRPSSLMVLHECNRLLCVNYLDMTNECPLRCMIEQLIDGF